MLYPIKTISPADVHLTEEQVKRIQRRLTNKDYNAISVLRAKMKQRIPTQTHGYLVRISAATLAKYHERAEINYLDGVPLPEFDCIYTDDAGIDYEIRFRKAKITHREATILNGKKSSIAKIECFVWSHGKMPDFCIVISVRGEHLEPQYCLLNNVFRNKVHSNLAAMESQLERMLCAVQNSWITTQWLLTNRTINYQPPENPQPMIPSDDMQPSTRCGPAPRTVENELIIAPNRTTIIGKQRMRLTWYWICAGGIRRNPSGTITSFSPCVKGPGRNSEAARKALSDYIAATKQNQYILK